MKRVRAVLMLEAALLLVFWPPFLWAMLAPRRLFYQSPPFLQFLCQASPYMLALDLVPGLLGLLALRGVRKEQGKSGAYRLAAALCLLHAAAGGLLLGLFLIIYAVTAFLRFTN